MKNANVWVICSILVLSLILGLVAPPEEAARGSASGPTHRLDVDTIGSCAPLAVEGVRYVPVDLRFDRESRSTSFSF